MIRSALVSALILSGGAAVAEEVANGIGAVLRGLDKVNGVTTDLDLPNGGLATFGGLEVVVEECRYPVGNPAGNAYAFLTIGQPQTAPIFQGWMMASAPALNALDHPRYDIWVLRCKTSSGE